MRLATDELVPLLHRHDLLHLRHRIQRFEGVMSALVTNRRDDCLLGSEDRAWIVAKLLNLCDDLIDLVSGSPRFDDNNHCGGIWLEGLKSSAWLERAMLLARSLLSLNQKKFGGMFWFHWLKRLRDCHSRVAF
jgi:hypothetical protein